MSTEYVHKNHIGAIHDHFVYEICMVYNINTLGKWSKHKDKRKKYWLNYKQSVKF